MFVLQLEMKCATTLEINSNHYYVNMKWVLVFVNFLAKVLL